MIPAEKIYLTIIKGGEVLYEKEGLFDIWTFSKYGGPAVSIRDVYEDKVIYEELPIASMSMSAPLVCIQTERE
nr:MAG TPA: hypothetical protein [Siphovirus LN-2020-1]